MGLNPVFFRKLFPPSVDTEYMKPRPCPVAVAAKQRSAVSTDSHFIFMSIAVLVVIMITGSSRYQKQALFLSVPRLNRNLKFIILIISNAITGILCIGTVKFPLFLFFKRQNSVRSTILFRFTEKIETPIRKAVSYKEVAFLLPLQNIFPWLTNKLLGNLLFI